MEPTLRSLRAPREATLVLVEDFFVTSSYVECSPLNFRLNP